MGTMSPVEMARRFADDQGLGSLDSVYDDVSEESSILLDQVRVHVDRLPPFEADVVDMYFFHRKSQQDIADFFSVSQPTVCYRLKRAIERIQFLLQVPSGVRESMLKRDLGRVIQDPVNLNILAMLWATTCQSEAAKRLGVTQGLVRYRFLRSVTRLEQWVAVQDRTGKRGSLLDRIRSYLKVYKAIEAAPTILWSARRAEDQRRLQVG
jgi:DNA-directed RNA polymerase specialized sigma24 family protein